MKFNTLIIVCGMALFVGCAEDVAWEDCEESQTSYTQSEITDNTTSNSSSTSYDSSSETSNTNRILALPEGRRAFEKCQGCHGAYAEKNALSHSDIIARLSSEEIHSRLKGYLDGTYGGEFKGLMIGQLAEYSDSLLESLAIYIDDNTEYIVSGEEIFNVKYASSCNTSALGIAQTYSLEEWANYYASGNFSDRVEEQCNNTTTIDLSDESKLFAYLFYLVE